MCLLGVSPVVPLLKKTISSLKFPDLTVCVLKKEMGKKGIFSIEVTLLGLTFKRLQKLL